MSVFNNEMSLSLGDMFASMGDDIFINGVKLAGIINDDQYDDDTGTKRELSVSFDKQNATILKVGVNIVLNNTLYTISRLPSEDLEDPFYTVELKRA